MRKDVANQINMLKEKELLNKSKLARRLNCNRRTVDRYLKFSDTTRKSRQYKSKLEDYKSIIIEKVDTYGSSATAIYKFIQKKGYKGGYGIVNNFIKKHKKYKLQV